MESEIFSILWSSIVEEDEEKDGYGRINDGDDVHIIVMKEVE